MQPPVDGFDYLRRAREADRIPLLLLADKKIEKIVSTNMKIFNQELVVPIHNVHSWWVDQVLANFVYIASLQSPKASAKVNMSAKPTTRIITAIPQAKALVLLKTAPSPLWIYALLTRLDLIHADDVSLIRSIADRLYHQSKTMARKDAMGHLVVIVIIVYHFGQRDLAQFVEILQ
jgi:hypothetical protein